MLGCCLSPSHTLEIPHWYQTVHSTSRMGGMCHSLIGMKQSVERQGGALPPVRGVSTVQGLWVPRAAAPCIPWASCCSQDNKGRIELWVGLWVSCFWWPRRVNTLKENSKVGRLTSPDFKTSYHAAVIKIVRHWQKKRLDYVIEQRVQEIDSHKYG